MRMVLAVLLLLLLFVYMGWHLWSLPPLPRWGRGMLVALWLCCVALGVAMNMPWIDRLPLSFASGVYRVGGSALFVSAYLMLLFLLLDFLRLLHLLPASLATDNLAMATGTVAVLFLLLWMGNLHYRDKKRVEVSLDSGGRLSHPVRMVCMSDLHLGYLNRRAELARWVHLVNKERPDVVLIAGDLIDRSLRPLLAEDMAAELRRIEAPVYACMGNHDGYAGHFLGTEAVKHFFAEAGIRLLNDSVAEVEGLTVVGRADRSSVRRLPLKELAGQVPDSPNRYLVVLDHQPYNLEEAEETGVDFQFSGHTHRGQFWPLSWLTDAIYECSWGSLRKGTTSYYVSSGLGIWGPACRIGTQSEYVVVTIK